MKPALASARKRTTVRTALSRAALRSAFAAGERLAPACASRLALDLWCRLPGNAGRRRDERPGPGERSSVDVAGRRVVVETWGSGPPVYLVHGWGGWRGQLGRFVRPLADAGFRVVAFDVPGHGDSGPSVMGRRRGNGLEFVHALRAVAATFGDPLGVIAHSYGCATTSTAIRDGLVTGRLVCVSPSVDPMSSVEALARGLGIGRRTIAHMVARIEILAGRPLSDFDPRTLTAGQPPTLVIHDRQDKEVAYAEGLALRASWPTAQLVSTDGLGHQRILRDPDVVDTAVRFLVAGR